MSNINLRDYHIILASNSPRRRELLAGLDLDFEVRVLPDIDETYPDTVSPDDVALYVARAKAAAYTEQLAANELVVTADTVVICEGEVLGKPHDRADAERMLNKLSGRTHKVVTGVCLSTKTKTRSFSVVTEVTFKQLTADEIAYYLDRYAPYDKAGAYGVQEWIGYVGVTSLHGSYFNVMGFPVQRFYSELKEFIVHSS